MLEVSYNDKNFFLNKIENDSTSILISGSIDNDVIKLNKSLKLEGDLILSKKRKIISDEKTSLSNIKDPNSIYGEVICFDNEYFKSILPISELELNDKNINLEYINTSKKIIKFKGKGVDVLCLNNNFNRNFLEWNFKTPNNLHKNYFKCILYTINNDNYDKKYNIKYNLTPLDQENSFEFKNIEIIEKPNSLNQHEFILTLEKDWTNNKYYNLMFKNNGNNEESYILSLSLIYNCNYFNGKI